MHEQKRKVVMPGLDPGINVFLPAVDKAVDGRVKPGHDGSYVRRRFAHHLWISVPVP